MDSANLSPFYLLSSKILAVDDVISRYICYNNQNSNQQEDRMISNELNAIVTQIKQQGKMNFLAGATENQIEEFEKKHNLKLPLKYREWLLFSDGGEFFLPAGVQMYGCA